MKLIHVSILAVASALFAIGAVAWLCVLPDGTKQTFRREAHVFVSLASCLIGALGLYSAVFVPVVLHALKSRWPFAVSVLISLLFGLLNIGPIVHGFDGAQVAAGGTQQFLDKLWGVCFSVGLLTIYLVVAVSFVSWAIWQRQRGKPLTAGVQSIA